MYKASCQTGKKAAYQARSNVADAPGKEPQSRSDATA
jgi:hypothetical protein